MPPSKTVLLIDDDADDRAMFYDAVMLADERCNCLLASSAEKGLAMLGEPVYTRPDVIFLDINMPRINGWQCLQLIRKMSHLRDLPVIIYSTAKGVHQMDKTSDMGAVYFLTKPSRFAELIQAITYILNHEWDKVNRFNSPIRGK